MWDILRAARHMANDPMNYAMTVTYSTPARGSLGDIDPAIAPTITTFNCRGRVRASRVGADEGAAAGQGYEVLVEVSEDWPGPDSPVTVSPLEGPFAGQSFRVSGGVQLAEVDAHGAFWVMRAVRT